MCERISFFSVHVRASLSWPHIFQCILLLYCGRTQECHTFWHLCPVMRAMILSREGEDIVEAQRPWISWGTNMYVIQYVWQNYETLLSCMIRAFILFWVGSSETLFSSPASSLRSLRPELCPAALLRGGSGGKCRLLKWNGSTLNLLPGSSPSNSREGASERERGEKQSPPEAWWD